MNRDFAELLTQKKILVIGDLRLDRYVRGAVQRISPEAPVPVVEVLEESSLLGGAANVANNLSSIGVQTFVMAVIGSDEGGQRLLALLEEKGVETEFIECSPLRTTTIKTRIVAGQQQIVRVDRERRTSLQYGEMEILLRNLEKHWSDFDAIILSDYGKGLLTEPFLDEIRELNRKTPKIITVDPKDRTFQKYRQFSVCTPNEQEAEQALGTDLHDREVLFQKGQELKNRLGFESLLITLGNKGMVLFTDDKPILIQTQAREVFDVTGAGDTVIAVLSAALACGLDYQQSAGLANKAAGVVVGKLGVATVEGKDLEWMYNQSS